MLSPERAFRLKPFLDQLLDRASALSRVEHDPLRFPKRFKTREDVEVAGLVASSLAYGRAESFLDRLDEIFDLIGESPARFAANFDPRRHRPFFDRFVYRFHVGADVGALLSAAGRLQRSRTSLEAVVAEAFGRTSSLRLALAEFVAALRSSVDPSVAAVLGPPRAFAHLLPDPTRGGATKRLLLYLRWMVRGGESELIDTGAWSSIPKSALIVPLDTHLARLSRRLGLTARRDASWRTAEEITASLRLLDPEDPVRYDFALCHLGMSGSCPARRAPRACAECPLRSVCHDA